MSTENLIKALTALIFVVILATPLFYVPGVPYPYTFSKALFFQALVELIFALWIILVFTDERYRPRFTSVLGALAAFAAVLLITSSLGADPWRSFWSTDNRAFGVFAVMHLVGLAVVLVSLGRRFPWKKLFYAALATSLIIDILAVRQLYGELGGIGGRAETVFGNPAILAGYLLFQVFLAIYLLFEALRGFNCAANGKRRFAACIFLAAALLVNVYGLFLTQSRGDILGLAAAIFILSLLLAIRPPEGMPGALLRRSFYVALIASLFSVAAFLGLTRSETFWESVPGFNRFREVSLKSETLLPRLAAYRAAWSGFLERPVSGIGWDNFNLVYDKYYDPKVLRLNYAETHLDKPHNFLLEDLAVGGAALTLARLALFVFLVIAAFRVRDKLFGQIFVALLAGYFVKSLFFFEALGSALWFYVLLGRVGGGLARGGTGEQKEEPSTANFKRRIPNWLAVVVLIPAIAFIYFVNIRPIKAATSHNLSLFYIQNGRLEEAAERFREAIAIWSPYRWNFMREYATALSGAYYSNPAGIPKEVVLEAASAMEQAAEEHPLDFWNHLALVDLYNQISAIAPEEFLKRAEKEGEIALKLSPKRQEIYFSLGKTKALKGDFASAAELAREALLLDEEVADSHFYYGLFSLMKGDRETARLEIGRALELGKAKTANLQPILEELGIPY